MTDNYMPQATFTVQLGSLVENGFDLQLAEYPIFDEDYRKVLNQKILSRYWFREIGQETPALFRFMLKRKLNEIMPFYNELYNTAKADIDPLNNVDVTTEHDGKANRTDDRDAIHNEQGSSEANAVNDSTSKGRTLVSATPQVNLSGHDDYATNLTDSDTSANGNTNSTENSSRYLTENDKSNSATTESYVTKVAGRSGILGADALLRWRETLLNIDVQILDELAPLFMGIYTDYANVM